MITTVLAFLLTLGVLIVVHEYGHYRVAVACGVKVLRFSVGFGQVLWRRQKSPNHTEFVLSALPLGGYVRMLDEREGPVAPHEQHMAFNRKPLKQRAAIVLAGPLANLALAVLLYASAHWIGVEEPKAVLGAPVVGSVAECYHALGAVHSVFKPLDGRFRDFVAIPKANGYQSLHTVLFGPYGSPIEVQIRTREMDLVAERGVAAHWAYKHGEEPGNSAQTRASAWIANLVESQRGTGSSLEFLENVKVDLFPDEVYLFTPKGDIMALPRNATALDFAYAVHTDVGNHAVAARVDRKLAPLRAKLVSGQTVEVITAKSAGPAAQWLEFVATAKARTAIRQQLKQLEHEDAVRLGHHMLDRALGAQGTSLDRLPTPRLEAYLAENRYPRLEAMLADIALGNRMPVQVALALAQEQAPSLLQPDAGGVPQDRILITGAERGVVSFAQCCLPIPGDEIMGYHSAGKGIVVHRLECPNVAEYRKSPERWVPIGWDRQVSGDFDAALRVEVDNRPGVLAQVAAAIAQADSNIDRVEYLERDTRIAAIRFSIEVADRKHLAEVMRRIRRLGVVHGVQRL